MKPESDGMGLSKINGGWLDKAGLVLAIIGMILYAFLGNSSAVVWATISAITQLRIIRYWK